MRTNYFFIALACLLFATTAYSQPQRIGDSRVYWELRNDTMFITGKGRMVYDKAKPYAPWSNMRKKIKHVEISEGVTNIASGAFRACYQLTSVHLPQSLRGIGDDAFGNDSNLKHLSFPDLLDSIGFRAFSHSGLSDTLVLPKHLCFSGAISYTNITYVEVPYKIDSVNGFDNSLLKSAIIPAGSSYLDLAAFCNDSLLQCVIDLSIRPQTFHPHSQDDPSNSITFKNVNRSKCRLVVPTSAVETYKNTPVWKDFLHIEGGGISVGVCFNDKMKGYVHGIENRFYKKGEKVTLTAEPRGQCTFSGWKSNGQLISTANPLSFTVTQDTMLQACFDGEIAVREPLKPVSASVTIYPNPTGDMFSVRSGSQVEEIVVSDLSGRVLLRTERTAQADVSALPQGLYLVRIRTEKGSCVKKLVKQ